LDQASLVLNNDGREEQSNFLNQSIENLNLKSYLDNSDYTTQIHSIVAQNTDRHVNQSNNILTCPNVNIEMIDCDIPQVAFYLMRRNELVPKIVNIIES
jgi:hypothetical protein